MTIGECLLTKNTNTKKNLIQKSVTKNDSKPCFNIEAFLVLFPSLPIDSYKYQ